jgi:hypothetical protein
LNASLPLRVVDRALVDRRVEEMMSNQLVLKRGKCVLSVAEIALVQSLPINKVGITCTTMSSLMRRHALQLFEAVESVFTVHGRAFDV